MSRVFANGPADRGSISGRVIPKTQKMVLDAALLNTKRYKVSIKGKEEQSREWRSTLSYTSMLYLLKKEPSGHPRLRSPTLLILLILFINMADSLIYFSLKDISHGYYKNKERQFRFVIRLFTLNFSPTPKLVFHSFKLFSELSCSNRIVSFKISCKKKIVERKITEKFRKIQFYLKLNFICSLC